MPNVTVRQALQFAVDNPEPSKDAPIDMPVYELVARTLFDIANHPDAKIRGSMTRATRAQKIIATRLVGLRRPGSNPAARGDETIEFLDLTVGAITV